MMRTSLVVILMGLFSLTISCAHKKIEETQPVVIQKAKKEIKVVKAEVKPEKKNRSFTCLVGKDNREVTLDRKAKRCEVFYTKKGKKLQVAWAEKTQDICDRAFNSIRSNIEGQGYQCAEDAQLLKQKSKKLETKKPVQTAQAETK